MWTSSTGVVTVTQSKHGEARKVPLNEEARKVLELLRAVGPTPGKARVFPVNAHNFYNRIFKPALEEPKSKTLFGTTCGTLSARVWQ